MRIRKRGNRYHVYAREGFGRRAREIPIGVFDRKADAERAGKKADVDVASGMFVDPRAGRASLTEMVEEYTARQTWAYNTHRNAAYALEHVRRHFGGRPIATISTSDVQMFVAALSRQLEPRTVAAVYRFVRQTIRAAHLDGIIGRDPCARVKLPRYTGGEIVVPSEDAVRALFEAAPAGFAIAVVMAAGLGLRASELAGLTEDRVQWFRREVVVDRQWHGRLDRFEPVKYEASNRMIPAADEVLDRLGAHIAEHGTGEHGVLLHVDGRPLNSNRIAWRWEQTAAGVDHTLHELRHFYASALLSAGVSIVAVQRALGHSKASVTLDTYGHLMPSDSDRIRAASGLALGDGADMGRTIDLRNRR